METNEDLEMPEEERPYIESCAFCGDGLLRFYRCLTCDEIVALCDECELMWQDIESLSQDPNISADTSYPQCPWCGEMDAEFENVTMLELEDEDLRQFSTGESI